MREVRAMRKTKFTVVFMLTILTVFLFSKACSNKDTGWKGTVAVENGVTIIKNPSEPIFNKPIFSIIEELVISGSEEQEEWIFQDIATLDVDEEGNIYVLDMNAGNIKIFDADGGYLRIVGQKGEGPGEFGMPVNLSLSPQKEIVVYDMGRRSLVFLDLEGTYIRRLAGTMFLFNGPYITASGNMIASAAIAGESMITELKKFDSELNPILTYISLPMAKPPQIDAFIAITLSNLRWAVSAKDEVIWSNILNSKYELNIYDLDGNQKKKISKEFDPIAISAAEEKKLREEWFKDIPNQGQWDIQFPKNYPPLEGLTLDDEGRIFVKTYEKPAQGDGFFYEVFDPEGKYLCKIFIDLKSSAMRFKMGLLYTIEEDADGFKLVKRYQVKWVN